MQKLFQCRQLPACYRTSSSPIENCQDEGRAGGSLGSGARSGGGPSGKAWQPGPIPPPQPGAGQLGGTMAAPELGVGHLPWDGLKPGWNLDTRVDSDRQGPWLGRAGLWGAGDRPCCSITGAGADSPGGVTWVPWIVGRVRGGLWMAEQGHCDLAVLSRP